MTAQLHCYRAEIQAENGKWLTDFIYAFDLDEAKASWKRRYGRDPEQAEWEYQGEIRPAVFDAEGWPMTTQPA